MTPSTSQPAPHGLATLTSRTTAAALVGIAGLHLAWGAGSSIPFATRDELADAVIGTDDVPPPAACAAVAVALLSAAALVADRPSLPQRLRTIGLLGVTATLGARAAMGFVNATEIVSPGSASPRFQRLDRRVYAPLCAALAAGSASALATR